MPLSGKVRLSDNHVMVSVNRHGWYTARIVVDDDGKPRTEDRGGSKWVWVQWDGRTDALGLEWVPESSVQHLVQSDGRPKRKRQTPLEGQKAIDQRICKDVGSDYDKIYKTGEEKIASDRGEELVEVEEEHAEEESKGKAQEETKLEDADGDEWVDDKTGLKVASVAFENRSAMVSLGEPSLGLASLSSDLSSTASMQQPNIPRGCSGLLLTRISESAPSSRSHPGVDLLENLTTTRTVAKVSVGEEGSMQLFKKRKTKSLPRKLALAEDEERQVGENVEQMERPKQTKKCRKLEFSLSNKAKSVYLSTGKQATTKTWHSHHTRRKRVASKTAMVQDSQHLEHAPTQVAGLPRQHTTGAEQSDGVSVSEVSGSKAWSNNPNLHNARGQMFALLPEFKNTKVVDTKTSAASTKRTTFHDI